MVFVRFTPIHPKHQKLVHGEIVLNLTDVMSEYLILFPNMCMLMQAVCSLEICADVAGLWRRACSSIMHTRLHVQVHVGMPP